MNQTRHLILMASLLLSTWAVGQEQGGKAFSLVKAQQYALENSPTVKNAALDVQRAESDIKNIRSNGLPQIKGTVDFTSFIDIPTQVVPANVFVPSAPADQLAAISLGVNRSLKYGVSASQLVFSGPYIVGLQAADLYRELSEQQLKKTEQEVKREVEKLYLQILVTDQVLNQIDQSITLIEDAYESAIKSKEQGVMDQLSVDEIALQLANTRLTSTTLEGGRESLSTALKFYMGLPVQEDIQLTDSLSNFVAGLSKEASSEKANFSGHIDHQIMMSQRGLAALDLKKEKYTLMPSIGAFFTHTQDAYSLNYDFQDWYPATIWGVQVSIPIFNSFAQKHLIDKAALNLEKAENGQKMVEQSLAMQLEMAVNDYTTQYAAWEHQEASRALAKKIYETNLKKFNTGLGDSGSVTESHARYLMAEADYFNALQQLLNAKINLHQALGAQ